MRKSALLLCFVLLTFLSFPIHAAYGAMTAAAPNATQLQKHQTVTVAVTMTDAPDVTSVAYSLQYDRDVFSLISCDWVWRWDDGNETEQVPFPLPLEGFDYEKGRAVCTFHQPTDINGETFVFKLKVKDSATLGSTDIGVVSSLMDGTTKYPCADQCTTVTIVDGVFGYTVSGTVTSFLSRDEAVSICFFPEGKATAEYEITVSGNAATYSVDGIAAGTYTMQVSKQGHAVGTYTIVVRDENIVHNAAIYPYGDASGDGLVNAEDIILLRAYLAAINPDTGVSDTAICGGADANGDGTVNTKDLILLERYLEAIDPNDGNSAVLLGPGDGTEAAPETSTLILSTGQVTAAPGETVCLSLNIEENSGFAGLLLHCGWDEALRLIRQSCQVENFSCLSNGMTLFDSGDDYIGTGTLLTWEFEIPGEASFGTVYEIQVRVYEAYDHLGNPVETRTVTGFVTVQCAHKKVCQVPQMPASCVDIGYTEGVYCEDCETYISGHAEVLPTGHSYAPLVTAPGCLENGYTTYTCAFCGDSYAADPVAAVGHIGAEAVRENEIPVTCTENGVYDRVIYCVNCHVELDRETVEVAATGHSFGDWEIVIAPWVEPGLRQKICVACGFAVQETLPPTHVHAYRAIVIPPKCDQWGCTLHVCDGCGSAYSTDYTPATGHNYVVTERIEGDCMAEGYVVYTCLGCGNGYEIAVEGVHKISAIDGVDATCTEDGRKPVWYCDLCGALFADEMLMETISWEGAALPAVGHKEGLWIVVKEATRTEDGLKIQYCDTCGEEIGQEILPATGAPQTPTEPTVSTEPTVPVEPTVPTESTEPTAPSEPTMPSKPTQPLPPMTEPTVPETSEPAVPETTVSSGAVTPGEGDDGNVPDHGSAFVLGVVQLLALMGTFCVLTLKRKYS